jgi:hypothetical protein
MPSVVSNLAGPAVGNLSSSQPDSATGQLDPSAPIRTENSVVLGARLANGAAIGANVNFTYTPVADTGFQLDDPFLSARKPLLERGGYSLLGQIRAYLPASDAAQAANLIGRTRLVLVHSFTPANSRWNIGASSYAQAYFYNGNRMEGATRMKFLL